ncbi:hypothetical protein OGATHE_002028 [Ogataea polymorpha]|uniref:Uncharacterized protein n=1 Tax=Ogataea polymorpha TaxID=460523 RepID=A0A9P8PKV0_9ASCO|nr:hypothetical protein OGATHE_002028 [Ogataea polymorpha]
MRRSICIWPDNGNDTVPQPVGGGRQTNTSRSDWQWEDLSDNNPSSRTPGRSKEENVDADEGDHGADGFLIVAINGHIDDRSDHRDQELIVDGAKLLEEGGTEVEDEVDTGPLLHHLHGGSEDGLSEVRGWSSESSGETSCPGLPVARSWNDAPLVLVVGHDLGEFFLNVVGIDRLAPKSGEHLCSPVKLALEDVVSRRFWEQDESDSKNDGPDELQSNRDSVGAGVVSVLGAVVNTGREQQSDGDEELVTGNDGTSDFLWRNFRQIQNHHGRNKTNTNTCYNSSYGKQSHRGGGNLERNTDRVDTAAGHNNGSSSKHVGQVSGTHSTKKGTCRKNRSNKRFLRRSNDKRGVIVAVFHLSSEFMDKVVHTHDTGNVTGVVSEKDTSKRTKGAHKISSHSQGSLDSVNVSSSCHTSNTVASHVCNS